MAMRRERQLGETPAIFVSDRGDLETLQAALAAGATDCLLKPYRRSALIRAISAQLNAKVERNWKSLSPTQRLALDETSSIYAAVEDMVDGNAPIQYMAVAEHCAALVDAATGNQVQSMLEAVKEHDNYGYVHSFRVAALLARFGANIGLSKSQQVLLAAAGLLHDVGKLAIRNAAVHKIHGLTTEEWDIVRSHVPASVSILRAGTGMPKGVITIAAQHHERLDGSGYPNGLKGAELNNLARMAAIVDAFVLLTDHRPSKGGMTMNGALKMMTEDMANLLDQELLARFKEIMSEPERLRAI
jgi:putative nucleotidyltransferase with HDIG domain